MQFALNDRMVLSLNIEDAGEEGSHQRQNFEACLLSDLCSAAGGSEQEQMGNTLASIRGTERIFGLQ